MREIKFRAWDRINGMFRKQQMIKEPSLSRSDISKGCRINDIFKDDEFIWMQYTGLKDSNGVEIYEGDLLSIQIVRDAKKTVTIVFEDGAFGVKDELFGWGYGKEFYPLKTIINNHKVEIIGNIHENSELLEGE